MKNINALLVKILFGCMMFCIINTSAQTTEINNFDHPSWYEGSEIGTLGDVTKYGNGKQVLVIINADFQQSVFFEFMMRNKEKYTTYIFTPAGINASIAPKMPEERDFGKFAWSSAFQNSVINYLTKEGIKSDVAILGFFVLGTQNAVRLATKRPDIFNKLIIVSGIPNYSMGVSIPLEYRAQVVNTQLAPRNYQNVTRKRWYRGLYPSITYSNDSISSKRYWEMTTKPTIPTMIRYFCEFMADDPALNLEKYENPTLIIVPGYDEEFKKKRSSLFNRFNGQWEKLTKFLNPKTKIEVVEDTRVFIFNDQPDKFDSLLADFLK